MRLLVATECIEEKKIEPQGAQCDESKTQKARADDLHHDICEECRVLRYLFNHISGGVLVQPAASPQLNHFELFTLDVVLDLPVLTSVLPTIVLGVSVLNNQGAVEGRKSIRQKLDAQVGSREQVAAAHQPQAGSRHKNEAPSLHPNTVSH